MQGIKPGPVNDMVILSARPRERKLVKGIKYVLTLISLGNNKGNFLLPRDNDDLDE